MIPDRLVDAHHHLWDLGRNRYPWLQDGPPIDEDTSGLAAIRRDYLPGDYLRDTATTRILASVHVEAASDPDDPVRETRWVEEMATESGVPSAIVAFARLERPGLEALLDTHGRTAALRGIRQMLNWEPEEQVAERAGILDDPRWAEGLDALIERDLSFDLQVFPSQLLRAVEVLETRPDLRVVLDHGGFLQEGTPERWRTWEAGIRRLARLPNVTVKVSSYLSVDPRIDRPGWHDGLQRFVDALAAAFGPDRMMFGSNLPVDGRFASFERIVASVARATCGWSPRDRDALFVDVARRVYRIPERPEASPGAPDPRGNTP